jgi:glucose dehydrogenase
MRILLTLLAACTVAIHASSAQAADWPMQRHDAARTGITDEALKFPLQLRWVLHWPERNAVFGPDRRSRLDGSYDAAVVGKTMFIGCEYNSSVVALDTETAAEKWRFFAEGAVRFAPIVAGGKVYFSADDGRLYCLGADDGKLRWCFDGAPHTRKCINHERIASA